MAPISEQELLGRLDPAAPDRPHVAVDVVVLTITDADFKVLAIRRRHAPFQHRWALPGGFVGIDESVDDAARRKLEEETGVRGVFLEQLYTFGDVERDPRMRVISVAYYALVSRDRIRVAPATDEAEDTRWWSVGEVGHSGDLAFDHARILDAAVARVRAKLEHAPVAFQLVPETFTLTELQRVYEVVMGRGLDKRNFRARVLSTGLVEEAGGRREGSHRPARLYRFRARAPAE